MTLKEKILFGAAVVVVAIVCVFGILNLTSSNGSPTFGGVGNLLAEHYIPYVSTNGGYNSALPITTSGALTSAYSVLTNGSGCLQMNATSTATTEKLTLVASTTAPTNGSGVITVVSYGTCP